MSELSKIDVGALSLNVQVSGDEGAPPVLLIHGWPDTHDMWRHQVAALNEAGYRTIAPDLRGAGDSDRPTDVGEYNILNLVGDMTGLLDALGHPKAHVIGHDWGSAISWALASFMPDRVDHLVGISVGHPQAFTDAGLAQYEKSWYMLLFQFEGIAEQWLSMDDFANLRSWAAHPDGDALYRRLAEPGALTAGLNIYRANVPPQRFVAPAIEFPAVTAPTMAVWGSTDMALVEAGVVGSQKYVSGPFRYERLEGVGHWVPLEAPDALNPLLLDFLPLPTA